MPLQGTTVDAPFLPMDEQQPVTASPVGELKKLTNGVAIKFQPVLSTAGTAQPHALRLQKRNGFQAISTDVSNPDNGNDLGTGIIKHPTFLNTLVDRQLVTVADSIPYVYAEDAEVWQQTQDYIAPTNILRTKPIYTGNNIQCNPDSASVGNVYCRVWKTPTPVSGNTCQIFIQDKDGTPILNPKFITACQRIKVVSDNSHFWVFVDNNINITVFVYDITGTVVGSANVLAMDISNCSWDINYQSAVGVTLACQGLSGLRVAVLSLSGSTVSASTHTFSTIDASAGIAYLQNDDNDGFLFVNAQNAAGKSTAYKLTTTSLIKTYPVEAVTPALPSSNAAGFRVSLSDDIVVYLSKLQTNQMEDYTTAVTVLGSGSRVVLPTNFTVQLASRAFKLQDNRYYAVVAYNSVLTVAYVGGTAQVGQPTYFLIDLATGNRSGFFLRSIANQQITHQADPTLFIWSLASPLIDLQGDCHLPLCYNAETVNQLAGGTRNVFAFGHALSIATPLQVTSLHTVGITDVIFENDYGTGVEFNGDLLIPGPGCTDFTGYAFSEQGFWLSPEAPTLVSSTAAGGLTPKATYSYILTFEWTSPTGNRVFSTTSTASQITMGATDNIVTLSGYNLNMTNREQVTISIYRAVVDLNASTTDSTIHYKVTSDLSPVYNDSGTLTWAYVDQLSDDSAAVNEVLYTEGGAVDHEPAPPFNAGTTLVNRTWLAGYDNAIWFSSEKVEGQDPWYSSVIARIPMPTQDPVTALCPLDSRLYIFCERSIWFIEPGNLPQPNGTGGTIPTPQRFPINNGGHKYTLATKDGIYYASNEGGIWATTRSIVATFAGSNVEDETAGAHVTGMTVDKNQRVFITLSNFKTVVWDTVSAVWSVWKTPLTGVNGEGYTPNFKLCCSWNSAFTAMDSTGQAWYLTDDVYFDHDGTNANKIITTIETQPYHLGGIKNYKRIWALQFYGTTYSTFNLTTQITYGDSGITPDIRTKTGITPGSPLYYEIQPKIELTDSLALKFEDDFTDNNPGQGFSLELVSFYVGLEKGLFRLPPTTRRLPPGNS